MPRITRGFPVDAMRGILKIADEVNDLRLGVVASLAGCLKFEKVR